ncbi:MAG: DUF2828 family protein [Lachnospiraceae bacterium]|nr:DUF2828 family protein [Lachnospiraceae bacterium]
MNFMERLHTMINDTKKKTENGAVGYATTGKALVDLNFAVASLRSMTEAQIIKKFIPAFYEDRMLAMKWLFFLRDVRGGLGERRTFRIIIRYLAGNDPKMINGLIDIMAEYGRYDDLLCLFETPLENAVLTVLKEQLERDIINMKESEKISLCAKWMPGNNTSSQQSQREAVKLQHFMGLTAKEYRKMLSSLRAYLDVTEVYMSGNRWEEIDYTRVASRANIIYRNAFMLHDQDRRKDYLKEVQENHAVIHAGVLMPHEIVAQYMVRTGWRMETGAEDVTLEALWKNLPDMSADAGNVLCVVDGSGSMLCPVGDGNTTALHVSNALGIYFAEQMSGAYHDKFITFSASPKYVDLSACRNLREKLELAFSHSDCSNTNIEATFELILQTAVRNHLKQEELPGTILVISDMEFDMAVRGGSTETLFDTIGRRFAGYGYRMPKLVFWNVNSRTNVIPVRENELGVALVSGFSVNICNMVLTNELDPFACLKKVLDSERYRKVEERLCS